MLIFYNHQLLEKPMNVLKLGAACAVLSGHVFALESFTLQDEKGDSYILSVMTADQVLTPQTEEERESRDFLKEQLNNDELQKPLKTRKPTEEEQKLPYFDRFMEKTSAQSSHRLLILYKHTESGKKPLGMGRTTSLTELTNAFSKDIFEYIQDHHDGLAYGYTMGGTIEPLHLSQKDNTYITTECMKIILTNVYKTPPSLGYMLIGTTQKEAVAQVENISGFTKIPGEEGQNWGTAENPVMCYGFIYKPE